MNTETQRPASLAAAHGSTLADYIKRQGEWSGKTFGHGVRTKGITAHIRKELAEIEAAPHDVEEWVDVVILALDGAWRAGYSPEQICDALDAKQAKNFLRTYPMPLSDDHPSEHIREVSNKDPKSPARKTRTAKGITLHAAPGYHFCAVKSCKTQMSDGSPTICPKHQTREIGPANPRRSS